MTKPHFEREKLIWTANLKPNQKLLLLCLNSFVDAHGECFPGIERLSQMCGCDQSTIVRIMGQLQKLGVISKTVRRKDGKRTSNLYHVDFSILQSATLQNATLQNATLQNASQPMSQNASQLQRENRGLEAVQCGKLQDDLSSINLTTQNIDLSRSRARENFGQLQPPATHSPVNETPVASRNTVKGDRSAGPVENWDVEAREWLCWQADWRESITDFKDEMLQAVADTRKGCDFTVTGNGSRNDSAISKYLNRIEETARFYYGEPSQINARAELLRFWKTAQEIAKRKQSATAATAADFTPVVLQPVEDTRELQIARLKAMLQLPNMRQTAIARAQQFGISLAELGEVASA